MGITNFDKQAGAGGAPGNPQFWDVVEMDLDASYVTGGYDLSAGSTDRLLLDAQIGSGRTIQAVVQLNYPVATWIVEWDDTNDKLKVLVDATKAEAANGTNLATMVDLRLLILSI